MDRYFCLYCNPDIFGNHEKNCPIFVKIKAEEERKKEEPAKSFEEMFDRILNKK